MFSLTDSMRKSFYTLSGLVTNMMKQDPLSGDVFIFINKSQTFIVATLPESPIKKSLVSPSLISHIIQPKYQYHMPFYRVVQQFKDIGFTVRTRPSEIGSEQGARG